nr:MAG TPA: hypothetical protein [Caudoviricetes sp.]
MKPSRKRRFFFVHFAQKSCYNIYAGGNSEYIKDGETIWQNSHQTQRATQL